MTILNTLDIAASGMAAQRTRMNVAAMNMANQSTTRTREGGPYKRRDVVLEAVDVDGRGFRSALEDARSTGPSAQLGVRVREIAVTNDPANLVYDPGHPDADERGYVAYPAVSGIKEMVNMLGAARAYEAGTTVIQTLKSMAEQALRIGR
jgi:flagellar basal-body rod protein FlgC